MFIKDLLEQKIKEEQALAKKKTAKDIAIGVSIGAAVGIVAGVLLVPKPDKETTMVISSK